MGTFKNCLGYHLVQTLIFWAVMGWTINQVQYSPSQDLRELVEKEGIDLDKCKFELKTFQIRGLTCH
jgi:hypothetical protein